MQTAKPGLTTNNPTPRIQRFFTAVDRLTDAIGVSVPQIVYLETLRQCPPDSFGQIWAAMLDQQGLQPLTTGPRRKQLHDGIHVLTGYGIDPVDEAAVQAFLLGAKFNLFNVAIGLGLLRIIQKQLRPQSAEWQAIWQRLCQAYQRGKNSQFDPDTWQPEGLWNLPMVAVQRQFGIDSRG